MTPSEIHDLERRNREYYTNLNYAQEHTVVRNMESEHFAEARESGYDIPPRILHCLASKAIFWLTWDGKMLPCGTFSSPFTLPLEEGFVAAWNRLPSLVEDLERPSECGSCEYEAGCSNCPANLQAETGAFDRLSPYICGISKERFRSRIRPVNSENT
jgi:radical SAM protein with 4Fe4S-binding SPASM domain